VENRIRILVCIKKRYLCQICLTYMVFIQSPVIHVAFSSVGIISPSGIGFEDDII